MLTKKEIIESLPDDGYLAVTISAADMPEDVIVKIELKTFKEILESAEESILEDMLSVCIKEYVLKINE